MTVLLRGRSRTSRRAPRLGRGSWPCAGASTASSSSGSPPRSPHLLGAAEAKPSGDHRLGGLGVELRPDDPPVRINCGPASVRASSSKPSGTVNASSCHSSHGPPAGTSDAVTSRSNQPISGSGHAGHGAAESVGEHLRTEADGDQRPRLGDHAGGQRRLGLDQLGRLGAVDVPLGSERQHEVDAVEIRPPIRVLTVALGECVAVLAQAVTDEPGIEVVAVADDQGTHAATVPTRLGSVGRAWTSRRRLGSPTSRRREPRRLAVVSHTPVLTSPSLSEDDGSRDRAQGREPAAHRRIQDPRRDEQGGIAGPGCRQRGHCRQRRQPRAGARLRRPPRRRAVRDLRTHRRTDHEDRGVPGVRRPGRRSSVTRSRRRWLPPGRKPPSTGWRSATPSTTRPWSPARARSASS